MLATHVFAGTPAPDIIHVNYTPWTVTVTVNGVNQSMSEGQIDEFVVDGMGGDDQINIEGSGTKPLHVRGGDGDDTVRVTPGSQNFNALKGPVFLHGDAGANLLLMSDQSHHTGTDYTLKADALLRPGMAQWIHFEQFGDVIFQAGQGADTINIQSTTAGVNYTVKAGGGGANVQDYIRVGSETSTLAELLGNLNIDGQEGTDRVEFRDVGNPAHDQFKLWDAMLQRVGNGPNIHFNNVKYVSLLAGPGANAIDVESTKAGVFTSVYAGDGNDLVRVAPTPKTFDAINAQVFVDGQGGADHVNMHDENGVNEIYTVDAFNVRRAARQVDYSNFEQLRLFANAGSNIIIVGSTAEGTPVYIDASHGQDQIEVRETAPGGPVTLESSTGPDTIFVSGGGVPAPAELILNQSHELQQLGIGAGGVVRLTRQPQEGIKLLKVGSLEVHADARLDLTDNALAWDYAEGNSPLDALRALLSSGHAGGAWTGSGITSSSAAARPGYALGYAEASDLFGQFPATFAGGSVDADTVVVRYARYGDANLDGTVNLNDFNRLAANFGAGADRTWSQGNFNFDENVNLSDFNLLAANFGQAL